MSLDAMAREVYSRQIMMKEIGEGGQEKLLNASVLVVGCGGLGAPALYYLAAMGIGHLGLCDGDVVSLSNLNRQLLFTMDDLGKSKATVAEKRLTALNPRLRTTVIASFLDEKLAATVVPDYDVVVDCLDNFDARFILNDVCVAVGKPFVHAGVGELYGQLLTVTPGTGPCLRCLFPNKEQKKEPQEPLGIIGTTPGVIGTLQALETMKYLLGLPVCNDGMVVYNSMNVTLEKVNLQASPDCICRRERGTDTA